MLSFVTVKEDLRIEMSYPFNEVTAVFLLNNPHYQLLMIMTVDSHIDWNIDNHNRYIYSTYRPSVCTVPAIALYRGAQ